MRWAAQRNGESRVAQKGKKKDWTRKEKRGAARRCGRFFFIKWLGIASLLLWGTIGKGAESSPAPSPTASQSSSTNPSDKELEKLLQEFGLQLWERGGEIRFGLGYKDNPTLRARHPQGSPLWYSELEGYLYRLPINRWSTSLSLYGEDTRYFDSQTTDYESFVYGDWMNQWIIGEADKVGIRLGAMYQDQVIDASITEEILETIQARGSELEAWLGWTHRWDSGVEVQVEGGGGRQWYREPLDDYWEIGPRLNLDLPLGKQWKPYLEYEWMYRMYDTRHPMRRTGYLDFSTPLRYFRHRLEIGVQWRASWGRKGRFSIESFIDYNRNDDNGDGYFAYHRVGGGFRVRYQSEGWWLESSFRTYGYLFDWQPVWGYWDKVRRKWDWTFRAEGRRRVNQEVWLFVYFTHEESTSNQPFDEYSANAVTGGILYKF